MYNNTTGDLRRPGVHVTSFYFDKEIDWSPMLAAEQDEQYFVDICQHCFINWNALYSNVTELCSWTAIDTSALVKVEIWCWSGHESLPKPKLSLQMMSKSYTIPVQRIHPLHHTYDCSESLGSREKSMGRTLTMWYFTRLNVMEILKPICLKEKPQH